MMLVTRRSTPQVAVAVLSLFGVASIRADTIWVSASEKTQPVGREGKIVAVTGLELTYEARSGAPTSVKIETVRQLAVDGETAFNAAEQSFIAGDFEKSIDGYSKTARSTTKSWLREWSSRRLIEAANQTRRFDAAATAYITLLLQNPELAARYKPALPDAKSTYLQTAAADVTATLQGKVSEAQQISLLNFLLEIQRRREDKAAVSDVVARITKLGAGASGDNPELQKALVDSRLSQANVQLDAKNYKAAADLIEQGRAAIVDPQQQAEALFILASTKAGLADPNDKDALLDAAMAYMRVAAHFGDVEGRPRVADALLATAAIHEKIGEVAAAKTLYGQIAIEFADAPAGTKAKQELDRLKAAK